MKSMLRRLLTVMMVTSGSTLASAILQDTLPYQGLSHVHVWLESAQIGSLVCGVLWAVAIISIHMLGGEKT